MTLKKSESSGTASTSGDFGRRKCDLRCSSSLSPFKIFPLVHTILHSLNKMFYAIFHAASLITTSFIHCTQQQLGARHLFVPYCHPRHEGSHTDEPIPARSARNLIRSKTLQYSRIHAGAIPPRNRLVSARNRIDSERYLPDSRDTTLCKRCRFGADRATPRVSHATASAPRRPIVGSCGDDCAAKPRLCLGAQIELGNRF